MKHATTILLALFVVASLTSGVALAQNIHFVNASAAVSSSGQLTVSFKEAGLGAGQHVFYTAAADGTAVYGCVNKGGNHPQASNKTTVEGPVSASGAFDAAKNGNITAKLVISPPPPPTDLSCPTKNMVLVLVSASYSGVSITDNSNGITENIAGTFTATFFQ